TSFNSKNVNFDALLGWRGIRYFLNSNFRSLNTKFFLKAFGEIRRTIEADFIGNLSNIVFIFLYKRKRFVQSYIPNKFNGGSSRDSRDLSVQLGLAYTDFPAKKIYSKRFVGKSIFNNIQQIAQKFLFRRFNRTKTNVIFNFFVDITVVFKHPGGNNFLIPGN